MIEAVTPRRWTAAVLLALAAALGGCASVPNPNPDDPFEGYNRGMQRFNDAVDDAVLAPVAWVMAARRRL